MGLYRSLKSCQILEDLKAGGATVMLGVPLLFQKILEGIRNCSHLHFHQSP